MRTVVFVLLQLFLLTALQAQEKTEKLQSQLEETLDKFTEVQEKSSKTLQEALTDARKKIASSKTFNDENRKLLEEIDEDFEDFDKDPTNLPCSLSVQSHVSKYLTSIVNSWTKCLKAYDALASVYQKDGDKKLYESTIAAKKDFVERTCVFDFQGAWKSKHASGWTGIRTVRGKQVIDFDGTVCTWKKTGTKIRVEWPHGGYEDLSIDVSDTSVLRGRTETALNSSWSRK